MPRLIICPNGSFRKSILRLIMILVSANLSIDIGFAQSVDPSLLVNQWQASWISVPGETPSGYGVYLFRKILDLGKKPDSFVIHISADNRYKLFVNETQVSLGPARGDLDHWNFTTLDIAPFLHSGKNIIAAQVWNDGEWRAEGQISLRTAFILQGDNRNEIKIYTDSSWKCIRDPSYGPIRFDIPTYYVAGPGELLDMNQYLSAWRKLDFPDSHWKNAWLIMPGIPKNLIGGYGTVSGWLLIPSVIPPMELTNQRFTRLTMSESVQIPAQFPAEKKVFEIPAHSNTTIILDQGFLTNAYPEIIFSGGSQGTISLSYAEAMFSKYPSKGNRNVTEGKEFLGRKDSIISNGSKAQDFTPLSFRTYRYLQIKIKTQSDPLVIEDVFGTFTGYPFQLNAKLSSDNPELSKIFEIGWRTARLCAMETYMDCPYYEQLQYIGDARIQALISLYNSGDERLLRNAMNQMDESRRPEGVTLSRHPSYTPQYIPTFSFWYIGMMHDYMMYGRDSNFIKSKLAGERQILQYFKRYQQEDGSLKSVPYWMFTDWVDTKGWHSGVGPIGNDGNSALLDLQLLWAYQLAADLESKYGLSSYVLLYKQYAGQLIKTIREKYWSSDRNLIADRSEKDFYSQHANALAIITGVIEDQNSGVIAKRILTDSTLAPASIYFKFYLHQALVKAGLGNDYLNWLNQWRENIKMGMTTWAEISDINNARSDCHAWGASPNIEFFRTLLGIDSEAPGFERIKIEPRLGQLKNISGEIPHPKGKIFAGYQWDNGNWKIHISLPVRTSGHLIWNQHDYPLKEGNNDFTF
ncbi:MAG TPA: alpha-L-rhamnosidase N-terminal domain-containing protein [Puia sp.]